jgi:hypothetical protein
MIIQRHHITYDPEYVVYVTKGEHKILTLMQWYCRKTVSDGFILALQKFLIENSNRAINLEENMTSKKSVPKTSVKKEPRKKKLLKSQVTVLDGKLMELQTTLLGVQKVADENIKKQLEEFARELDIDLENENWNFDQSTNTYVEVLDETKDKDAK